MKIKLFIVLLPFISCIYYAQQNTFNKEAELQRFVIRGGNVEEKTPGIYKLTYGNGTQRVFNFNTVTNQNNYPEGFDSTIINVWEIDTTLYANKFKFWKKVYVVSSAEIVPFEDINNNGLIEWYGSIKINPPFEEPVIIQEQSSSGVFNTVYTYDSTIIGPLGIGDVNSDGRKEVYMRTSDTLNGKFYKADSLGAFPTTFDFIFYYYTTAQINDMTFGDFDKDSITDCAFIDWPIIFIATYDSSIDNFYKVFEYNVNDYSSGFAINDFDQDGNKELVIGTSSQQVYVIEAEDTNQYLSVWRGSAPSVNAYMITSTNDIDGNGKPEFWIGGQDFTTGISTFWCYEAIGDNGYIPVAGIELRYLVSLFTNYMQASDINNDGIEELVINIGNYLLILKFTGKPNQHSYSMFYSKIDEKTQPSAVFRPSTVFDLNSDGKKDILLSMDIYPPPAISYILVQDTITSISDEGLQILDKSYLAQNYPNPFNPSTQIQISIKGESDVKVAVYNILGKEIKLLLDENLPTGEYTIQWSGKDNGGKYLPGGAYFIQMIAGSYQKTIKTILLK